MMYLCRICCACLQGFPDFHVFVGLAGGKGRQGSHGKGTATVDERYMQVRQG